MTKEKIIEKLEVLHKEIKKYGEYLEKETYHPYEDVYEFASKLKDIINEAKDDDYDDNYLFE